MEKRSNLAAFLGNANVRGIAVFNEGFVYAAPSFCERIGWESATLLGISPRELILPPFDERFESGSALLDIQLRHREREETVPAELFFFEDPQQEPLSGMILLRDTASASVLLDAQALHDIRNPLNTILGYGRIFQEDERIPAKYRKASESIVEAAQKIHAHLGSKPETEMIISPSAVSASYPDKNIKILIADDDIDNRTVLGLFLKKNPFTLLFANDGAAAFETALKEKPDLIFMDLHMPDMDGREAALAIKKHHPEIKIVALTADLLAVDEETGDTLVFDRKLHKPFDRKEVRETITALTGAVLTAPGHRAEPSVPRAEHIPKERLAEILSYAHSGRISSLENLIAQCKDPHIKAYLGERLSTFDLEGIMQWAKTGSR